MQSFSLLLAAASVATAQSLKGFNSAAFFTDQSPKSQTDFENEFRAAQNLPGQTGFNAVRLFTTIQHQTPNTPIAAIPAAINTNTQLLLGLWASAGQENINNEIAALTAAVEQYGSAFTDRVVGISVGSEDLYRISPTGIAAKSGPGAEPFDLVKYIGQVRQAIANNGLSGKPVGHVDTWNDYVNASNSEVISNLDFVGMDAYPYFESTKQNAIEDAYGRFYDALNQVKGASQGKPVWVTETGWPTAGPQSNLAIASTENAKTYWDQVGCSLFDNVNTFWYILQDGGSVNPSFGVLANGLGAPNYDLSCPEGAQPSGGAVQSGAGAQQTNAVQPSGFAGQVVPTPIAEGASSGAYYAQTTGVVQPSDIVQPSGVYVPQTSAAQAPAGTGAAAPGVNGTNVGQPAATPSQFLGAAPMVTGAFSLAALMGAAAVLLN